MAATVQSEKKQKKQAAALQYDPQKDKAPIVVAAGQGVIAEKILEKAQQADVPVVEDSSLAQVLSKLGVGDEIPAELYAVVAQVLLFVSDMDSSYGKRIRQAAAR